MSQLAEELLALIVDIVADSDDGNTLSQLALVNHQLLTLVRERRTAALIIGGPDLHSKPQKLEVHLQGLLSLIQGDPSFAECIISLTLSHDADSAEDTFNNIGWRRYGAMGWLTWSSEVTDLLSQILLQLPCLRSLRITSDKPDAFVVWTYIPPELQDSLFHCFSLLSLDTLVLERILNMEITPLIDCSNLKELSLVGVTLSPADLEPVGEAVPMDVDDVEGGQTTEMVKGHLQSLEVGDCGVALEKLLEGFERDDAKLSISRLKSLTVHASMYDNTMKKAIERLLRQTDGSLEELRVRVPVCCDRDVKELKVLNFLRTLQRFSRLTSLVVEVVLSWCPYRHSEHAMQIPHSLEPLDEIIQVIGCVCHEGHLGRVRLDLTVEPHPRRLRQSVDPGDLVALLDAVIQSALWPLLNSAFSSVSHMALSIDMLVRIPECAGDADVGISKEDDVAEELYARMPDLTKSGILNVYCISDQ